MEILYIILDCLPSQTVTDVEKALDFRFSNTFWRSRISVKFFHEIEDVADDNLDWKRLYLKLQRRFERSKALATRRYLLERLDEVLSVLETSTNVCI